MKKLNTRLRVSDLIDILKGMPQDAMVVVENTGTYIEGTYYATRSEITLDENEGEKQVTIGTNYSTRALGSEDI